MRGTMAERTEDAEVPDGLRAHWRTWLGATDDELAVLGARPRRAAPGRRGGC